jgi:NAD(P)-dependent dehydrogenase (short-subunit alcohol dehydrogenase family)
MELAGKSALITGGAQGIGAATAELFAGEGASVAVADLDGERLDALRSRIREAGGDILPITADCGQASGIDAAIEQASTQHGGLDILVCGAIHRPTKPFMEVTEEDLDLAWQVNIKGYFLSVQKAVPKFREREGGKVVLISSTFGFVGAPNFSVYCTSKGAVVNMARTLAFELASENINVNAVAPGPIMTEGMRGLIAADPTIETHRTANMPLPRFGTPEEVAESILFLASDRSRYVHGHNLVVDGGYLAALHRLAGGDAPLDPADNRTEVPAHQRSDGERVCEGAHDRRLRIEHARDQGDRQCRTDILGGDPPPHGGKRPVVVAHLQVVAGAVQPGREAALDDAAVVVLDGVGGVGARPFVDRVGGAERVALLEVAG